LHYIDLMKRMNKAMFKILLNNGIGIKNDCGDRNKKKNVIDHILKTRSIAI